MKFVGTCTQGMRRGLHLSSKARPIVFIARRRAGQNPFVIYTVPLMFRLETALRFACALYMVGGSHAGSEIAFLRQICHAGIFFAQTAVRCFPAR